MNQYGHIPRFLTITHNDMRFAESYLPPPPSPVEDDEDDDDSDDIRTVLTNTTIPFATSSSPDNRNDCAVVIANTNELDETSSLDSSPTSIVDYGVGRHFYDCTTRDGASNKNNAHSRWYGSGGGGGGFGTTTTSTTTTTAAREPKGIFSAGISAFDEEFGYSESNSRRVESPSSNAVYHSPSYYKTLRSHQYGESRNIHSDKSNASTLYGRTEPPTTFTCVKSQFVAQQRAASPNLASSASFDGARRGSRSNSPILAASFGCSPPATPPRTNTTAAAAAAAAAMTRRSSLTRPCSPLASSLLYLSSDNAKTTPIRHANSGGATSGGGSRASVLVTQRDKSPTYLRDEVQRLRQSPQNRPTTLLPRTRSISPLNLPPPPPLPRSYSPLNQVTHQHNHARGDSSLPYVEWPRSRSAPNSPLWSPLPSYHQPQRYQRPNSPRAPESHVLQALRLPTMPPMLPQARNTSSSLHALRTLTQPEQIPASFRPSHLIAQDTSSRTQDYAPHVSPLRQRHDSPRVTNSKVQQALVTSARRGQSVTPPRQTQPTSVEADPRETKAASPTTDKTARTLDGKPYFNASVGPNGPWRCLGGLMRRSETDLDPAMDPKLSNRTGSSSSSSLERSISKTASPTTVQRNAAAPSPVVAPTANSARRTAVLNPRPTLTTIGGAVDWEAQVNTKATAQSPILDAWDGDETSSWKNFPGSFGFQATAKPVAGSGRRMQPVAPPLGGHAAAPEQSLPMIPRKENSSSLTMVPSAKSSSVPSVVQLNPVLSDEESSFPTMSFQDETTLGGPSFDFSVSAGLGDDDKVPVVVYSNVGQVLRPGRAPTVSSTQNKPPVEMPLDPPVRKVSQNKSTTAARKESDRPVFVLPDANETAMSSFVDSSFKIIAVERGEETKHGHYNFLVIFMALLILLVVAAVVGATVCLVGSCRVR
jgi:hypothetical protein